MPYCQLRPLLQELELVLHAEEETRRDDDDHSQWENMVSHQQKKKRASLERCCTALQTGPA